MIIQQVPQSHVQMLWPKVKDHIESALRFANNEYTSDQLKVLLVRGEQQLLIAFEDETIHGSATIQLIDYPNYRVAFVTSIGGRLISSAENFEELVKWAKFNGATKIQGAARESIERLWKRLFNFERRYVIVEKDI